MCIFHKDPIKHGTHKTPPKQRKCTFNDSINIINTNTNRNYFQLLKQLKMKTQKPTPGRLKQFLIDDIKQLESDIQCNNEANIEQFFSYWRIHIKDI